MLSIPKYLMPIYNMFGPRASGVVFIHLLAVASIVKLQVFCCSTSSVPAKLPWQLQ